MTNTTYVGVQIADLHNGAFDANIWYRELEQGLLTQLESMEKLDFVIILGDFFHTKISANSDHAKYAFKFLSTLMRICHQHGAKLRIIKGTESHDNQQLQMFDGLHAIAPCDFNVISTAADEWLFEDMHVLYLPEEYISADDFEDYYTNRFFHEEGKYDMICGHGMVDKAVFVAHLQESEATMKKAPVFLTETLEYACKGPIYFGHIHKPMQVGRFRYVGSYSRWAFGETEEKGFIIGTYLPTQATYNEVFHSNAFVRKFDTLKITYRDSLAADNEQAEMKTLLGLVDDVRVDYIRLEITIPESHPKPMMITAMINELFARHKHVKIKIVADQKARQKQQVEERVNELLDRYGFIFEKTISLEDKVSRFIHMTTGTDIPSTRVLEYLTKDIQKIHPSK